MNLGTAEVRWRQQHNTELDGDKWSGNDKA